MPRYSLSYKPAVVDNPLKGLVPYKGDVRDRFPHSMEFQYLPLSALVVGKERYDWSPLENLLNEIAGRGHCAVFRVFLEYPGQKNAIPRYLVESGLKVVRWLNTNTQPLPPTEIETPDYSDPRLRDALKSFIAALGSRYDNDPRIGFITAGLLGTWGEWHDYPRNELFASLAVQDEVMTAYETAFRKTPILLRYPAGPGGSGHAPNAARRFGYHDDSFAWATLDTGKPSDSWFYLPALKSAGRDALEKWKRFPIGGEIRPEAWGKVFDTDPGDAQIQNFRACVAQTHATWLMDSGMFAKRQSDARIQRATAEVQRMGYEFHIADVATEPIRAGKLPIAVSVENRGVAPFYYDWPIEFALLAEGKKIARVWKGQGKLVGRLPGRASPVWAETLDLSGIVPGRYRLLVRAVNPLKNGLPLRFANTTQDADLPGWLTLLPDARVDRQAVR